MNDTAPASDMLDLVVQTARQSFAQCSGLEPLAIGQQLEVDGILGMALSEAAGGSGLGPVALCAVVEAAGEAGLAFPLAEVLAATACLAASDADLAGQVASGKKIILAARAFPTAIVPRVPLARIADAVLLVDGPRPTLHALDRSTVQFHPSITLDHRLDYADIIINRGQGVSLGDETSERASAILDVLRAAELMGLARAAFDMARNYAVERRQFGRPLTAQQTVSTELARDHYRLQALSECIAHAAEGLEASASDAIDRADAALALAAQDAVSIIERSLQLHGAIGFTWDLPVHERLRRAQVVAAYKTSDDCYQALGARFIDVIEEN
jgi:alkylation response protein AidB-like acyl-CoA dehydrogenase